MVSCSSDTGFEATVQLTQAGLNDIAGGFGFGTCRGWRVCEVKGSQGVGSRCSGVYLVKGMRADILVGGCF